jgi:hypothetical protein
VNRKAARAILQAQRSILKALSVCEDKLQGDEKTYFENYWGAHVKSIMTGHGYGSAPVDRAADTLEGLDG